MLPSTDLSEKGADVFNEKVRLLESREMLVRAVVAAKDEPDDQSRLCQSEHTQG